ncbi:MAG TPA: hypothetical protein VIT44_06490 [Cyclobacteriaceae bacterium]
MKLNFSYLMVFGVVLTLITLAGATPALAQEEGIPGYELQDPVHPGINTEEKTLLLDPESRAFRPVRDSIAVRSYSTQKKASEAVKPSGKPRNEEDPLSFNFLYYIIQKFKASDIIDQQE